MKSLLPRGVNTLDFKIKILWVLALFCISVGLKGNEVTYSRYSTKDFFYERLSISPKMQGSLGKEIKNLSETIHAGDPNRSKSIAKLSYSGWISRNDILARYKFLAQKGDAQARFRYAVMLLENNSGEECLEAITMLKMAAKDNFTPAIFLLGNCYENAIGCFVDYKEAAEWYSLLRNDSIYYPKSELALAHCYIQTRKFEEADKIITPLLKDGNARALYLKYKLLIEKENKPLLNNDLNSQAMQYCKKAAEAGDLDAACELGKYYLFSVFSNDNNIKKLALQVPNILKKAVEANHPDALWLMSHYYAGMNGITPKDKQKSWSLYLQAAECGNLYNRNEIATFELEAGNPQRGFQWIQPGILKKDPMSLYLGGCLLAQGQGIKRNLPRAATYFKMAKQNGWDIKMCDDALSKIPSFPAETSQDRIILPVATNDYKEYKPAPGSSLAQFLNTLETIQDSTNSFEEIEGKLSRIKPSVSKVGTETVSIDEMDFLLTLFKLEYCSILRKGRKTIMYAEQIEYILKHKTINVNKLSKILWNINLHAMTEICLARAENIKSTPGKAISRLKNILQNCNPHSPEYQMGQYTLICLYMKQGDKTVTRVQIVNSLKNILEYFIRNRLNAYASIVANQLALAIDPFSDIDMKREYLDFSRKLSVETKSNLMYSAYLLQNLYLMSVWHFAQDELNKMTSEQRNSLIKQFDSCRRKFFEIATSDYYIIAAYLYSILFKQALKYPSDDILQDIEKYLLYKSLLFEATSVGVSDDNVMLIKNEILRNLAESKQIEKLNFWNALFEKIKLREGSTSSSMTVLTRMVSRLENANQILALEKNKASTIRDSRLILMASEVKKELEKYFDSVKHRLSKDEQKKLDAILSDSFIINPNAMHQLSGILPQDVACVQIIPVGNSLISYLVSSNNIPLVHITSLTDKEMTEKQLIVLISQMRSMIQVPGDSARLQKILNRIYSIIWNDLESSINKLGIKKIIINSSGYLRYIPFSALYDGEKYLVEKYQITNITGLDLIRLSQSKAAKNYNHTNAVIFADPDGTLPAGKNEGEFVSKLFQNAKLYIGNNATLDEFETLLGNVNFIHLATHAKLDADHPELSYIQFANGQRWTYSNMLGFNIRNVDSIVLSACSTAVKPTSDGGEIESMAYQLLRNSPAGSILASFWKVEDTATADFMVEYYQHIINSIKKNHTLDRGGALRQAQLTLLKNPKTSHPYYWAAFTLFGDFR